MIDFPYSETEGWFGVSFAFIGTVLSIVLLLVGRFIGFRTYGGRWPLAWYPGFLGITAIAIVLGLVVAVPAFWTVKRFRDVDVAKITGWNAYKVNDDDYPITSSQVEFTNADEAQRAFRLLQFCKGVYHQHDTLGGGYLLRLRLSNSSQSDLYLRVYRTSSTTSRKVVVPRAGVKSAGEYDCPELQQWVVDHIDPLFTPKL